MDQPLISVHGLTKWYAGVHALKAVSLEVKASEVVGLVGDNGAGKSTLIKILSGVHRPDSGEIRMDGRPVEINSPKVAMRLGIETIYQDASMVPTMSIARNLFVGREPLRFGAGGIGIMDHERMRRESTEAIANVDLHLRSPGPSKSIRQRSPCGSASRQSIRTPRWYALLGELSGGQRQGVAIARAMHFKSRVLILDEPTNHLSVKETAKVLGFVRGLPAQGVTGILISHNLHHVMESCDRIVVMARGEIVADRLVAQTSIDEIQDVM
jgi:simple sugar transport system ATP-binding protein